jgi:hypothetical protein
MKRILAKREIQVRILETRPLSRTKRWVVADIIERAARSRKGKHDSTRILLKCGR